MIQVQVNVDPDEPIEKALSRFKKNCTKAGIVKDERIGNALLDVTTFRRQTFSRQWNFEAVFIVKSDLGA